MPITVDAKGRARKRSGNINVAPGSTPRYRRRNAIAGQWRWHTIEMMQSPAFRVLSLAARRVLDRIEIELAQHGGKDNGNLPCTYDDFEKFGIHRHCIAPAIRELVALGFIEITRVGRAGNAEFRIPHLFLITHKPTDDGLPARDDWKRIKTVEEAQEISRQARAAKTESQWRKMPRSSGGKRTTKAEFYSAETGTTVSVQKPPLLSISTLEAPEGAAVLSTHLPAWTAPVLREINPLSEEGKKICVFSRDVGPSDERKRRRPS
jgi:hypothetical protein